MGQTKVYNPTDITIVFSNILIDSGFADGEFVKIAKDGDSVLDVVGTDGEVAISFSNDQRATVTLLLMQTSDLNDKLSQIYSVQQQLRSPQIGKFYLNDRNGKTRMEGTEAWIAKPPDVSFDKQAKSREWKLRVSELVPVYGGNYAG